MGEAKIWLRLSNLAILDWDDAESSREIPG